MRFYCQLASEGIKREFTQGLFDLSNYTYEEKDGDQLVRQVKDSLGDYFRKKKVAAQVRNSKIFVIFLKQLLVECFMAPNNLQSTFEIVCSSQGTKTVKSPK